MGNSITGDSDSLSINANSILNLSPTQKLVIPDNVLFQVGNTSATGLISNSGSMTVESSSNMILTAGGVITFNSGGETISLDSTQILLPLQSEILFSNVAYISTIPTNSQTVLSINSQIPITVDSIQSITLDSPEISLSAVTSVNIPDGIPLEFGPSSSVFSSPTDGTLHISNMIGVSIDQNVVINGSLTVNGPTTEIESTKTVMEHPIISLGISNVDEYVKDRGVEFFWGDGNRGFMGFSQSDGERFYLLSNRINTKEVFSKDGLGDLQVNNIYVNTTIAVNGLSSNLINGDPQLDLNAVTSVVLNAGTAVGINAATSITLNAGSSIFVPLNIPLEFGSTSETITGTTGSLVIASDQITLPGGNLLIGTESSQQGDLSIGTATFHWTDSDTFTIGNVPNLNINSVVTIPNTLYFGEPNASSSSSSIQLYQSGDLTLRSSGNIVLNQPTILEQGFTIGSSNLTWNSAQNELVWSDTMGSPLNLSLEGNITRAQWEGMIISTEYGGTGHVGSWHAQSVVFVGDSSDTLIEDPGVFTYNHMMLRKFFSEQKDSMHGEQGNILQIMQFVELLLLQ
ncbi:hypothetical protein BDK51DRAFT_52373 [Blyttiomyces helicus]|uniref:Uncharacterized protein n=1 Tax=Blyttiomyces helicus TaxID=388810 RepID=A0A4P9WP15_9FUNG|nr:hypothetical protein BDK51DRAFT_52373 [Blyttiomyces helicus]|eukprot:RKO92960.1 hypothetical protein BDK51DRAFT_52373 [Blyttiomyces helicus]